MSSLTSRFAAATSVLALAVALGGTSYAAVKIKGNQIAKNAITSKHVKNDSLTGKDIKEGSLAKVPSAASADTAANAGAVGGNRVVKVSFRAPTGTGDTVVFNDAGLVITVSCGGGDISLVATSTRADSSIFSFSNDDFTPDNPLQADVEDSNFDGGDTLNLLAGDDGDIAQVQFGFSNTANQSVVGTIYTDEGTPDCLASGFITVG